MTNIRSANIRSQPAILAYISRGQDTSSKGLLCKHCILSQIHGNNLILNINSASTLDLHCLDRASSDLEKASGLGNQTIHCLTYQFAIKTRGCELCIL